MTIHTTDRSLIQRETTPGGGTYSTIPQALEIQLPSWARKIIDTYIMDQGPPVRKLGGMEAQELTFKLAWDPGNTAHHQVLFSDFDAKTERSYQAVAADTGAAQFRFNAAISNMVPSAWTAEGVVMELEVTLALSAQPVITW